MKRLIVTVEADGSLKIDAQGFRGPACESKLVQELERSLGQKSGGARKPEFHATIEQQQKAGQG